MSRKNNRHRTYEQNMRRNRLIRRLPVIIILALLFAAIAAGVVAYVLHMRKQHEEELEPVYEEMSAATFPMIKMAYAGQEINSLRGYAREMDPDYIRENLYILEDTYDIPVNIYSYGVDVMDVSFRISNAETSGLIQENSVDFSVKDRFVFTALITADNVLEQGTDYILDIMLDTTKTSDIHYYCRIRLEHSTPLESQLALVKRFNTEIFKAGDDSAEEYVSSFLQTDYNIITNSDLSYVTGNSSLSSVMWGSTKMSLYSESEIHLLDADTDLGYYRLDYLTTRKNGTRDEYYRVWEYFRLRTDGTETDMLDYERHTSQIFIPSEDTVGTSSAVLGIMDDPDIPRMCSLNGDYSCFAADGSLWQMNTDKKSIKRIFSFSEGLSDVRGNYNDHNYKFLSVSDEGNIQFLLYGYMNAGLHEGEVGIGLYNYFAETDTVKESLFIPTNLAYSILDKLLGTIFYLNENNTLYFMIDEYLYRIGSGSGEAELVVSNLTDGNYMVHSNGRYVAWHYGGSINDANSITVLDMESEQSYSVFADSGCSVKILGFLNKSLVYGQGKKGDIYTDEDDREYLLMTKMFVVNENRDILSEYSSSPGYYIDSVPEYNRIILYKVAKKGNEYADAENFTVFATELEDYPKLEISSRYVDDKRTVFYLNFADSTTTAGELVISESSQTLFTDEFTADIGNMLAEDNRYYVYAKGKVSDMTEDAGRAIVEAYEAQGIVLDPGGKLFYRRGIVPGSIELTDYSFRTAIEKAAARDWINVTGINLTQADYFIGNRIPVAWEYDGNVCIIKGYNSSNYYTVYDTAEDAEYVFSGSIMNEIFPGTGHVYIIR